MFAKLNDIPLSHLYLSSLVYIFWWHKPLDVNEPVMIALEPADQRDGGSGGENDARSSTTQALIDESTPPPDLDNPVVLHTQVEESKKYSRWNHILVICPGSIAIKSKAFFDLVTYAYSEGIQETSAVVKKQMALYGVISMVVEGSLMVSVGGLHLPAWNVYFPSAIESLLWKGCSFGMILFPSIVVFIASFTRYERDLFPILWEAHFGGPTHRALLGFGIKHIHGICTRHARKSLGLPQKPPKPGPEEPLEPGPKPSLPTLVYHGLFILMHYALVYLCLLSLLCYALCNAYIVVESYISMRDPPAGVFKTPRWSDYWPHF